MEHNPIPAFTEWECNKSSMRETKPSYKMRPVALAINQKNRTCRIIRSKASFAMLKSDFDMYQTQSDATNWNGCDSIERTLAIEKLTLTGRYFHKKLNFADEDSDMGHSYTWSVHTDILAEVLPTSQTCKH